MENSECIYGIGKWEKIQNGRQNYHLYSLRWRCKVILIVDDVILSSSIAPNSINNNSTVYAFVKLIMHFFSHTGSGNEKNRLWLTLFCEVFGHPHAAQVTILSRVLRPVVSAVPLCPRWIFIVPLYPRADITERLVRPVMSAVPLCPRWIFIVPLCPHE